MNITDNKDKQNRVCQIQYAHANQCSMVDYPGAVARCVGSFVALQFSDVKFEESDADNGSPVDQNIEIIMRGQNSASDIEATDIAGCYLILKLFYTNGDIKVVGTPENPVVLKASTSGSPAETKLYAQRISAEKAKYLIN